jgi:hypothetical protein
MSGPMRAFLVALGLVLVAGGFAWRSLEQNWGAQLEVPPYTDLQETQNEDQVWEVVGWEGSYSVEPAGDGSFVVVHDAEGAQSVEVFRGTEEEAHRYKDEQAGTVLVSGTRDEVDAWIQDHERGPRMLLPNVVIGAGALIAAAGVALGRRRPAAEHG